MNENTKIEIIANDPVLIIIEDRGYDSKTDFFSLIKKPFKFVFKPRQWLV